jgi:hypothetical protein
LDLLVLGRGEGRKLVLDEEDDVWWAGEQFENIRLTMI